MAQPCQHEDFSSDPQYPCAVCSGRYCNPSFGGQVGTGDPYNLLATRLTELVSYMYSLRDPVS